MASPYDGMWKDLGLDPTAHDALLQALGKLYQDYFLSQRRRPEGMQYFDFVMSEVHGLRIKELVDGKAAGHKVVGTYCVFVPEELIRATDATMVGLCAGADWATERVEEFLPRTTCSLIKSALGFKLGKVCPYLEAADMVVGENTCDGKKKAYETFKQFMPNLYVMDLPQVKSDAGRALLRTEYVRFLHALEELTGVRVTPERLKRGMAEVNRKRAVLARLARLRRANPAPISGLDALLANQVSFYDDLPRFCDSVGKICDELEGRIERHEGVADGARPRLVVSGCPMAVPNWKLQGLLESSGAVVVAEESCIGERGSRNLVDVASPTLDGLMDALVDRYMKIDCAVFTPNEERVRHVEEMVEAYGAHGVVHYSLQFCQPYQMESVGVERRLEEKGVPTLRIETDYGQEDVEQLKTRVQAFLERLA